MNDKLRPAIMGGLALFALVILTVLIGQALPPPLASALGCCNCLWPIAGGALATFLYIKKSPTQVPVSDGAMLGVLSGVAGGLLYLIIGLPIAYALTHAKMEAQMDQLRQAGFNIPNGLVGLPLFLIGGFISLILYTALATIGGLIGVPLFEKRKDGGTGTPPPQNFGGGSGGGDSGYTSASPPPSNYDNQTGGSPGM